MRSPATPSGRSTSIRSRKGLTVEIGNTDAEGRLILADALALADEETPDLLDRHGDADRRRARRARARAAALLHRRRGARGRAGAPRRGGERSAVAAAAVAALRLDAQFQDRRHQQRREPAAWPARSSARCSSSASCRAAKSWLHFDIYAWTPSAKPGRPEGGECQAARALYALLKQRYGASDDVHRHQGQGAAHHHDRRAAAAELVHGEPARHAAVAGLLAAAPIASSISTASPATSPPSTAPASTSSSTATRGSTTTSPGGAG